MNPMLAHTWKGQDLTGWLLSEKLDGVRALWFPLALEWVLCTRRGHRIRAPEWWLKGLPRTPLDGEMYIPKSSFDHISGLCRTLEPEAKEWTGMALAVFDAPFVEGGFATRYEHLRKIKMSSPGGHWYPIPQFQARSNHTVDSMLAGVLEQGGEGLIAKHGDAPYEEKRSRWMLKIKPEHHGEAEIVGYQDGRGRNLGKVGAYIVRYHGNVFEVGVGLKDSDRENPLAIGDGIRFSHFGTAAHVRPPAIFRGALL